MLSHRAIGEAAIGEVRVEDGIVFEEGVFEDGVFVTKHLPAITLKTEVLDFDGRSRDGQIVRAVLEPWYEIVRMILQDPARAHLIGPRRFEEIIAGAWARILDKVELTPASGDKGRDVIGIKWGQYRIRIFDQVKAYRPGHLVTEAEVREMAGVLYLDHNVSKAYITTTSDFAPGVWNDEKINSLIPYRLELTDGNGLLTRLRELSGSTE